MIINANNNKKQYFDINKRVKIYSSRSRNKDKQIIGFLRFNVVQKQKIQHRIVMKSFDFFDLTY